MTELWASASNTSWEEALLSYPGVVEAQGVKRLPELNSWYYGELPELLAARDTPHVTLDELERITEWKMARGVWRQRNLLLVRGNTAENVQRVSTGAFAAVPDATSPVKILSTLAGVGPATASAVVAARHPELYPFFDELVASQIPQAEAVTFNLKYYAWYAEQLRERAKQLGADWTPAKVEKALWANSGGKADIRAVK